MSTSQYKERGEHMIQLTDKEKAAVKDYLDLVNNLRGRPSDNKGLTNGRQSLQLISKEPHTSKAGNEMLKVKWRNIETGANDFVYLMNGKKAYKNTKGIEVGDVYEAIVGGVGGFVQVTPFKKIGSAELPTENKMCAKHIIAYDIEVFKYNFSFVYIDILSGKKLEIEDDLPLLEKFLKAHENDIFVGYNNVGYDKHIRKGIRDQKDPYKINKEIIDGDKKNSKVWKMYNGRIDSLCEIDLYQDNAGFSLKEHNAFNGLAIQESEVDFDIDRELTASEKKDNMKYNTADVEGTVVRFLKMLGSLKTKAMLLQMYNLDYTWLSKTNASLIAEILKAKHHADRGDLFDKYPKPDWIRFDNEDILKQVNEWVLELDELPRVTKTKDGEKYETTDLSYTLQLRDLEIKLGSGGVHGAVANYIKQNTVIYQSDVGSLYPWTMVLHDYISRNIPEKYRHFYQDILEARMKYKAAGDKAREKAMKLVLNTMYGVLRAKFNALFDPRQAILINITGQLAMLDLADKIQPYGYISAMNTDSINYEPFSEEDEAKIEEVKKDWCKRSGYTLDTDILTDIAQRDINNYICRFDNGEIKTKGAISMGGGVKWSKAIVMNAVKEYFMNNIEPEEYIKNATDLRDFQIISKTGYTFKETRAYINEENEEDYTKIQKVNRSFAVKKGVGQPIKIRKFKLGELPEEPSVDSDKYEDWLELATEYAEIGEEAYGYKHGQIVKGLPNEPDNYIIDNNSIDFLNISRNDIDDNYYISEAKRMIAQYENGTGDLEE